MSRSSETLYVWDCNEKPCCEVDCSLVFWSDTFDVDESAVSILDILELHSDRIKKKYLKFIYTLGNYNSSGITPIQQLKIRENLSYWWMTLLVEKSNWAKSPQISTIIKLMALELYVSGSDYNKIVIKSGDRNLVEAVRLFCISIELEFKDRSEEDNKLKALLQKMSGGAITQCIKAGAWLLREVLFSIPYAVMGHKNWLNSEAKFIYVSYVSTLEIKNERFDDFNSTFWGPLPEFLTRNKVATNWLFLPSRKFSPISTFKAFLELSTNKRSLDSYTLLSSFFNLSVFLKTITDWRLVFRSSRQVKESLKGASQFFWPLIERDVVRSLHGVELMSSLFYLALFESAQKKCSQKFKVIYLAESQPWEIGLISAFQTCGHNLVGFAHSTIRYWDLRYYNDSRCYHGQSINSIPRPDCFAVNGTNDRQMMVRSGYPSGSISEVESLRYLYLNELMRKPVKSHSNIKRLLILGDFLKADTEFLLSFVQHPEVQSILSKIDVVIKPHPSCPLEPKDIMGIDASITNSGLGELILNADVVYTGNVSSAAVEAYCLGKQVISAKNPKKLDMSPLRGVKNVFFVSNAESFKIQLERCLKCKISTENANLFHLNSDLRNWRRILSI